MHKIKIIKQGNHTEIKVFEDEVNEFLASLKQESIVKCEISTIMGTHTSNKHVFVAVITYIEGII